MNRSRISVIALLVIGITSSSADAEYYKVFSRDQANTTGIASPFLDSVTVSGGTAYALTRDNSASPSGSLAAYTGGTFSTVMTPAQWTGTTDPAAQLGAAIVGNKLRSVNFFSATVWEIDLGTGTPTLVVPKAAIDAVTTGSAALTAPFEVLTSGDIFAYNSTSNNRQVIQISAGNVVSSEISVAALNAAFGVTNPSVNGMGVLGSTLYLGSNSTDSIVAWDTAANTSASVLSTAQITAVTGGASVGFDDIFGAPDGYVYFVETTSNGVLRFLPSNPSGTLSTFLSSAALLAGPASSTNLDQLAWWQGNLAWTQAGVTSGQIAGFYAVPEPTTALLSLLAIAALGVSRRR
jgi:hypothetical protein